jgi:hypothetical protein
VLVWVIFGLEIKLASSLKHQLIWITHCSGQCTLKNNLQMSRTSRLYVQIIALFHRSPINPTTGLLCLSNNQHQTKHSLFRFQRSSIMMTWIAVCDCENTAFRFLTQEIPSKVVSDSVFVSGNCWKVLVKAGISEFCVLQLKVIEILAN